MKTKQFKVVAVSSNTNSFGYKQIVIVAADGEAWEILKQAYGSETLPKEGDVIDFQTDGKYIVPPSHLSVTSPHRIADCPAKALKDIFTVAELEAAKLVLTTPQKADYTAPAESAFDVFEVRTVGTYVDGIGNEFCEQLTDDYSLEEPELESVCWSVYGHYRAGTVRCIADCDSFESACELAVELGGKLI